MVDFGAAYSSQNLRNRQLSQYKPEGPFMQLTLHAMHTKQHSSLKVARIQRRTVCSQGRSPAKSARKHLQRRLVCWAISAEKGQHIPGNTAKKPAMKLVEKKVTICQARNA